MLLQFLSVLALFFVVLNYADDGRKIKWLILTIISSGFLYAFYGIIHIMVQPPSVKFVISTFTNRNHFAAYLEMIIPLSIAYALVETNKLKKIIIVFLAVVMGVSLFLSLSRAGIVSFFLAMLLLVILLQIKRQTRKGIAIIITLLLFLSIFLAVIGFSPIAKRLGTIADPLKAMYGRIEVIKETPRLVKDFPVFGTGLGTFIDIFQKYKSFSMSARYRFSHNEPIQLLVETGILGFGLFFLFLLTYLMRIMNVWFKRRDPRAAYLTLGCFVGIFSIIFHSFFDFVFHVPANAFLFSIILALSFRIAYLKEKQDLLPLPLNRISVPYYLKFFIIILFCLFFIFIEISILKRYLAEQSFLRIKDKFTTKADVVDAIIEYKKSLKGIEKAIILNPLNSHYFEMKADILAEMGLREDLKSEVLQEWSLYDNSEKFLLGAERFYQQAINLNPTNADYH
ncbi:MAG: O-antigen ligase family protein, partial [Candidatus Omnitrophica bacterium]|nr:O-antigen ligase family protein [Candidatus Omnitrophota bacterium]